MRLCTFSFILTHGMWKKKWFEIHYVKPQHENMVVSQEHFTKQKQGKKHATEDLCSPKEH